MKDKLKNNRQLSIDSRQLTKFLLSTVNCLLLAFFFYSCNSNKNESHEGQDHSGEEVYYCPMDSGVVQKTPGTCPKCKMELVKKEKGKKETVYYCPMCPGQEQNKPGICKVCNMDLVEKPSGKKDTVYYCPMCPGQEQDKPGICKACDMDLVIKPDSSEEHPYSLIVNPVNVSVLSSVKAIKPSYKSIPAKVKAFGYVAYDERRIYNVSTRTGGRIENLYLKYPFQPIKKGQPLFEIFSHDLLSAQHDYLNLKNNDPEATDLIEAAKNKLVFLGMTESQVINLKHDDHVHPTTTVYSPYDGYVVENMKADNSTTMKSSGMHSMDKNNTSMSMNTEAETMKMESSKDMILREGAYVGKGETVFKVVNTDIVWGILEVYSDQLPLIKVDQPVNIEIENTGAMMMGKVDFIEPTYKEGSQTARIRVYLPNKNQNLKIGNLLSGEIDAGIEKGLWLPQSAVYDLGRNKVVFIKSKGAFETRKVITGAISGELIQIREGIRENDEVAENAQFMIDSESFVKVKVD